MFTSCNICHTVPLSQLNYAQHINGKKHKMHLSSSQEQIKMQLSSSQEQIKMQLSSSQEQIKMQLSSSQEQISEKSEGFKIEPSESKQQTFQCTICQTGFLTEQSFKDHIEGKKHKYQIMWNKNPERNTIVVRNLPPNCDVREMINYVCQFGEIGRWYFNAKRRFARFIFVNNESVTAIAAQQRSLHGHDLIIDVWKDWNRQASPNANKRPIFNNSITNALEFHMSIEEELATLKNHLLSNKYDAYNELCGDLVRVFAPLFSQNLIIYAFGSTVFDLAFMESDLDVVVDPNGTLNRYLVEWESDQPVIQESCLDPKMLNKLRNCLYRDQQNAFSRIVAIRGARVPIIKFYHCPTGICCDVSLKNVGAVQNTKLIRFLMSLDPRVKPIMLILKYLAKYLDITKPGLMTNYALIMMIIFYFQQLEKPILPPIAQLQQACHKKLYIDGWECSFVENWDISIPQANKSTLLDLLVEFFDFYSKFECGIYIICPLIGKPVPKVFFVDGKRLPTEMAKYQKLSVQRNSVLKTDCGMCVQDPFFLDWNLTRSSKGSSAFQNMCCNSLSILKKWKMNANTGFLKHLLQELALLALNCQNMATSLSIVKIDMEVGCIKLPIVDSLNTLEDFQRAWWDMTDNLLKEVLSKICQFTIKEVTEPPHVMSDESTSKLRKFGNNSDVHTVCETDNQRKTIICESTLPSLRRCRAVICENLRKEGVITDDMAFIEKEEAVSKYLVTQNDSKEIVHFKICFRRLTGPTHILLELLDIASGKGIFKLWSKYLCDHIPGWLAAATQTGNQLEKADGSNL